MYEIVAKFRDTGESEVVDTADTLQEANYLAGEYSMAYAGGATISVRKPRVTGYNPDHPNFS